jgi:hypothetical protein
VGVGGAPLPIPDRDLQAADDELDVLDPVAVDALPRARAVEELQRQAHGGPAVALLATPSPTDALGPRRRPVLPRLHLVSRGATPPVVDDVLEDWIRLPATLADLEARLDRLRRDARAGEQRPVVSGDGRLVYGHRWVALSPRQEQLARVLAPSFEGPVTLATLLGGATTPMSMDSLRSSLHQLRRIVDPLGLEIVSIPTLGYSLRRTGGARSDRPREAPGQVVHRGSWGSRTGRQ